MKQNLILLLACLTTQIALSEPSLAEKSAADNAAIKKEWESRNAPFKPFRLIGNIHYVGASGISSFLITTPGGHFTPGHGTTLFPSYSGCKVGGNPV